MMSLRGIKIVSSIQIIEKNLFTRFNQPTNILFRAAAPTQIRNLTNTTLKTSYLPRKRPILSTNTRLNLFKRCESSKKAEPERIKSAPTEKKQIFV